MNAHETRYPCPVCLGTMLHKVRLARGKHTLVLDACTRCGGIWFDAGEVQMLRQEPKKVIRDVVPQRLREFQMRCHNCTATIGRNVEQCPACDWKNVVDCPVCARPLTPQTHLDLRLDMCAKCKGVWFDHIELAAIWTLALADPAAAGAHRKDLTAGDGSVPSIVEVLAYSPDVFFYGAYHAGAAIQGGGDVVTEVAGGAAEAAGGVGELAAGAFESVVNTIGDLFGSFDF